MSSEQKPIIVQSDKSILIDADHPRYEEARNAIAKFSELVSSPEHVHTYRITPISLWNAASLGLDPCDVKIDLGRFSRYNLPQNLLADIDTYMGRYGKVRITPGSDGELILEFEDPIAAVEVLSFPPALRFLGDQLDETRFRIDPIHRGEVKWALIKLGYPVDDRAGYRPAAPLRIRLREGEGFRLRDYQRDAAENFCRGGDASGGHGVVVLPCGAGKTVVGMAVMERVGMQTLILVTSTLAARQWIRELLDKTDAPREVVGEYTGERKEIRPITIATYHIVAHERNGDFPHFRLFTRQEWGLVVYDEVHLLPAPVFRITAAIQATRRLGLTATMVREDGRVDDVFCLIGPKKYDVPWKEMELRRFVAEAHCYEVRVPLDADARIRYAEADRRAKFRIAAENPRKIAILQEIAQEHADDRILIIGQYIRQVEEIARTLGIPLVSGATSNPLREELYDRFRRGEVRALAVTRVANYAIDLPQANVAIQVSGTFGSRQEEAQRLGRILRPKEKRSFFYSVVSADTIEQDFSLKRQRFLAEQGYKYFIEDRGEDGQRR